MCNSSTTDFSWTAHKLEQTSEFSPLSARYQLNPIAAAYAREMNWTQVPRLFLAPAAMAYRRSRDRRQLRGIVERSLLTLLFQSVHFPGEKIPTLPVSGPSLV
jgi:hypothetical protein